MKMIAITFHVVDFIFDYEWGSRALIKLDLGREPCESNHSNPLGDYELK